MTSPANTPLMQWQQELRVAAKPEKTAILSGFFKTGKGEYGEGDIFIGLTVPDNRSISRRYSALAFADIAEMINSHVHEFRLAGMLALVERYKTAKKHPEQREAVVEFYLANGHKANNWDLVDLSSPYILGHEIAEGRHIEDIDRLIESGNLWLQRIAMVAMLNPVMKHGDTSLATATASRLISHPHDLMRKAVGWVMREVGKKDAATLRGFLAEHISVISATTLSYATEKFSREERMQWRTLRRNGGNITSCAESVATDGENLRKGKGASLCRDGAAG